MAETHGPEKLSVRPGMHHWVQLSDVPKDAPVFDGTDVPVQRLVDYLDQMYNLYAFLDDHPQVSADQALAAIREYVRAGIPAHSDRGRVSGIPVFRGSRVPARFLFGHLADGVTVDEYLLDYPTAERDQAVRAIELAGLLLEAMAYESALTEAEGSPRPQGTGTPGRFVLQLENLSRRSFTRRHGRDTLRRCRRLSPRQAPTRTPTRYAGMAEPRCTRRPHRAMPQR